MIVTELMRGRIQYFKRTPGFQVVLGVRERFQLLIGCPHRFVAVHFAFFALPICPDLRKEAGPVEVQRGCEMFLIEGIHERGPTLGNVAMAKEFPDHRPILTFDEGIIVGLAGAGFGEFDEELAQESSHPPIDVFRAIVRMESPDEERKRGQQLFQSGNQIRFTDFLHRTDHLKLRDLIHCIDVIHALLFVPIALMDRLDTEKAGLPRRMRFPTLADGGASGPGLLHGSPLTPIALGVPQVVQMADGDGRQTLILGLAKELTGPLTEFLDGGPTGGVMAFIHGGQHANILRSVPASKALHGALAARHPSRLAILLNQARELLPRLPADLQQIANDQAFMGLGEGQILKRDQARLNPLITVILGTEHRKRDGLGPRQEVFPLRQGRQRMESHDGFHPPIMPETQPGFRLTSC